VAGDRESESRSVAVRTRAGKDLGVMSLEAAARLILDDAAARGHAVLEG